MDTKIDRENTDSFGGHMTDSRVHDSIIMKHDNKRVRCAVCGVWVSLLSVPPFARTHNQTAKMMTMNILFEWKELQKSCRVIVTGQEFNEGASATGGRYCTHHVSMIYLQVHSSQIKQFNVGRDRWMGGGFHPSLHHYGIALHMFSENKFKHCALGYRKDIDNWIFGFRFARFGLQCVRFTKHQQRTGMNFLFFFFSKNKIHKFARGKALMVNRMVGESRLSSFAKPRKSGEQQQQQHR